MGNRPRLPDGGSEDAPPAGSSPERSRILVAVAHDENRRLLVDWLAESYEVLTLTSGAFDDDFDLCIVDERTFRDHREQFLDRKEREGSVLLPYLLLSSTDLSRLPPEIWEHVDEVIAAPVAKAELRMRLEGLLEHRRRARSLARRNDLIEALHGSTQEMDAATDPERVCAVAVRAARRALDLPLTAIWLVDETGKRLEPVAETDESEELFDGLPVFTADDESLAWEAFTTGETIQYDDLSTASDDDLHDPETPIRAELVVPLGDHGVLITGTTDRRPFDDNEVYGAELLAANTTSALDRAEREYALSEKTAQMEFFNSILRHDVLNGMMVVRSRAEMLAETLDDEQDLTYANAILSRSDDIVDVVQRVRTIVETLSREGNVESGPIDLSAILSGEVDALRSAYPSIDVTADIPDCVTVSADELLAEVFGNVLTNAIEHNEAEGLALSVSVEEGPEYVTVRIADTGSGISDERKESIFRRGETGHVKSTGSGFGLFFVDSMVEEYGGRVWVEDATPDAFPGREPSGDEELTGAVFVIELPTPDAA